MSRARLGSVLTVAAVVCMSVLMLGQERDRAKIDDKYKWNLADIYPSVAAWRAAKEKATAQIPTIRAVRRESSGSSPQVLADALETMYASRQGAVAALRLREHARRRGHPRVRAAGHAAGDGADLRRVRRAGRLHRARGAAHRQGDDRQVPRGRAAPEDVRLLSQRHRPPRGAHAERVGGEDPRRRAAARRIGVEHLRHPGERRFPVSDDHVERRPDGEGGPGRLRRAAHLAEPQGSRAGDVGLLHGARLVQPHLRHDDELERPEGAVLREGAEVPDRRWRWRSNGPNIPDVGVHAADRRREQEPADVPSLPAAAQADDGHHRPAPLLRPLRAAGRVGRPEVHARGSAEARAGVDGAARRRVRLACVQRAFNERWLDWYPDRRQAIGGVLERRRLRRAPVHAAQLPRAVQRHEHADPRTGPHDAQLLLEQDAAVPDRRTSRRSWPRSHRRSTRRCSSSTC